MNNTPIGIAASAVSAIRRGALRVSDAPSILLSLLACDAERRVRQRLEALPLDRLAAHLAFPEPLGLLVQAAQGAVDLIQLSPLLGREQERLLALHRVGALVGHVKRVGAEIPGRSPGRVMVVF